jgi:hypothetical protein
MPLFDSARAKIERARKQTDALRTVFEGFYKSKPYSIRQELDPQAGEKRLVFHADPLPLEWSVIIGEIVHNLRSALDHSIYELTCIEAGHPLDGTEFPVFKDESKYFEVKKRGEPAPKSGLSKIRGIKDERRRAIIRDLQPFEFRKTHKPHEHSILAFIHELNIVDKHRTLHLCRMATTSISVHWLRDTYPISNTLVMRRLEDGAEFARWKPVGDFNDEVDMESEVSFEIAFGDSVPILEGKGVITICEHLIRGVERVLHYLSAPDEAGAST